MIFYPKNLVKSKGIFTFSGQINAISHPCLNNDTIKEFWYNFSFRCSTLSILERNEFVFMIGNAKALSLDGAAYSINVEPSGICVFAENETNLKYGFMTLIDMFKAADAPDNESCVIEIDCCQIKDSPQVQNRMVHFCVFPETEIWELQRFIRFCAVLKYTHIILEFWGMLKYDCMNELSWSHGYTKEQIRPLIVEAKNLGIEIVPMFNHWAHASAGRERQGKHVVLDQNPALQTYFSEDGWCWDFRKPKVRALLRQIRCELIEICGEGKYFHIGCDEAYNFEFTEANMQALIDFINEISDEMKVLGRRIFIWGDMLLYYYEQYNPNNKYWCHAPTADVEKFFLSRLSKDIVIADWQYNAKESPVETCSVFQKEGFDCVLCPWDTGKPEIKAALATVKDKALMGYMHTTWHTLSVGMPFVTMMAIGGFENFENLEEDNNLNVITRTAALLRKVMPINGDYPKAGWSKFQISSLW